MGSLSHGDCPKMRKQEVDRQASTSHEVMDAIVQPRPHGAIAISPLAAIHTSAGQSQLLVRDATSFLSWRASLAASARSQSRKVTIFGRPAVALGQMIQ